MSIWKQDTDLDRLNSWSANTLMEALGIRITRSATTGCKARCRSTIARTSRTVCCMAAPR